MLLFTYAVDVKIKRNGFCEPYKDGKEVLQRGRQSFNFLIQDHFPTHEVSEGIH